MVREIPIAEFAEQILMRGVKRIYYTDNFASRVQHAFALWELAGEKHCFGDQAEWILSAIGEGHKQDTEVIVERIKQGEKILPFIIVHLMPTGQFVVWDGNRRCLAIALLHGREASPDLKLPAYILDHREEPF